MPLRLFIEVAPPPELDVELHSNFLLRVKCTTFSRSPSTGFLRFFFKRKGKERQTGNSSISQLYPNAMDVSGRRIVGRGRSFRGRMALVVEAVGESRREGDELHERVGEFRRDEP